MTLKTRFMVGVAGCALAANSVAFAATPQTFESGNEGWSVDTRDTVQYAIPSPGGLPSGATTVASGNQVLVVEGTASYTASDSMTGNNGLVDMMIKASRPDDALEPPDDNAQIAIAVDSTGLLKVYCKNADNDADWYSLGYTADADEWVRVSLKFDYANSMCQVRINGKPMRTTVGYGTANGSTDGGSWYKLASAPVEDPNAKIARLSVSGCTAIDEVVLDKTSSDMTVDYNSTYAETDSTVPAAWFDQYGIDWNENATYAGNRTAKDNYLRCLSPFSIDAFGLKGMEKSTSGKVKLSLPTTVATATRKVEVVTYSDANCTTEVPGKAVDVTGQESVVVDAPSSGVYYYRLRASDK